MRNARPAADRARCATGCWTCTSRVPPDQRPRWPGGSTRWTGSRHSSTSSSGTVLPAADAELWDLTWAQLGLHAKPVGLLESATTGAGRRPALPSSPRGSLAPATCMPTRTGDRPRRSTSSWPMTASPCAISFRTTRSTTPTTAKEVGTGRATTGPGTAVQRARPPMPRSVHCDCAGSGTSSPHCCSARACPARPR